ncbi:hypothetical protein RaK2_00343 [Klebsiella phage vB_KleM_RaK2]|uniref:Uncharacterized protein n=1 Tax=Klebsiella phage vB_KleM_RaK2 TaxID=1147094 RepID=H6X4F0_9CAUD|nr:hypothetical protein F403_gp192 [Klebsiella phage vB_KleM_RaK2]AFA44616.1 hypothetical protein RaK2_00343 [Klebsiella phage vB_KleM_RaK2]
MWGIKMKYVMVDEITSTKPSDDYNKWLARSNKCIIPHDDRVYHCYECGEIIPNVLDHSIFTYDDLNYAHSRCLDKK